VSAWPSSDREAARFLLFAIQRMLSRMRIEDVVDQVGNRFAAVVVSARRARQINAYFHQLGGGIGHYVPPQVHSLSRKPLTIAMEEISEGKVSVEREEG
jgi:DNA-directed RNA polymerase subunit omega